jgi:hypothetical protein
MGTGSDRVALEPIARTWWLRQPVRPLLGAYARPDLGGWVIRLEWRDGRLAFVTAESTWQAGLRPGGAPGAFVVEPGSTQAGEPVVFHRRADGQVASVYFADSTWVRLAAVPDPG